MSRKKMSSVSCEIFFDNNPRGIFQAGQYLTGRAVLTLLKDKDVDGVSLRISGQANCGWTRRELTGEATKRRSRNIRYHADQMYFDTLTDLVKDVNGRVTCLRAGKHTYSFSCALPAALPCSFEGSHGSIRYSVVVILKRHRGVDSKYKTMFKIHNHLDLNSDPRYKLPVKSEGFKKFWGGFSGGPLMISTEILYSGYVPGQHVEIRTHVDNSSGVEVKDMRYYLKKIITYHSTSPCRRILEEKLLVAESIGVGVPSYKRTQLVHSLIIPHEHPPRLDSCSIMDVRFEIKVEARVSTIHRNLKLSLPVTLGTIPIERIHQPVRVQASTIQPLNEPPPTYEESEGMYRKKYTTRTTKESSLRGSGFICYYEKDRANHT